jgi:hypothetical protein
MIFSYPISTPPNTSKETPVITLLPITKGVIHHWQINFAPGHWRECYLEIKKGSELIIPSNSGVGIRGDTFPLQGSDWIYIANEPYELIAYTWNIDTRNAHALDINVFMKPLWTFSPYSENIMELIETEEISKVV